MRIVRDIVHCSDKFLQYMLALFSPTYRLSISATLTLDSLLRRSDMTFACLEKLSAMSKVSIH